MTAPVQQQVRLPLRKAVHIAWRNLRVRWWRSMLVTSGIILALAFLTYVLCSDALSRSVVQNGSAALKTALAKQGVLTTMEDAETRRQTWWLVGLALLVSFVGILNAMLMSVTERFAEIGTMKCLGALDGFIVKLFLLESLFQGISGTALGVLIGAGLALAEGFAAYGAETAGLVPVGEMARIAGACLLIGTALTVVGGLYPARRAAKMQPVAAMRAEV